MATESETAKSTDSKTNAASSTVKGCCLGCGIGLFILLVVGGIIGFFAWKLLSEKLSTLSLPGTPIVNIDRGTVQKKSADSWIPVISGEAISEGEQIKTLKLSRATITFPNGSQFRLDENTETTIKPSSQGISLVQTIGRTWSRVPKLFGRGSYEIETPTAVATVRGTSFSTTITPEETGIDTDQDSVEVAAIETAKGERTVLTRIVVEAGYSTRVLAKDIPDLRTGKIQLKKEPTKPDVKASEWFQTNEKRDKETVSSLNRHSINPLDMFRLATALSPGDVVALQGFLQKLKAGQIQPTDEQAKELEVVGNRLSNATVIDESLAADAARALAIIDPGNFSDTEHWTKVLSNVLPYYKYFESLMQKQK